MGPHDIMFSFDIVSLLTRVPLVDMIKLLEEHLPIGVMKFFRHILATTYFQFGGEYYKQADGMVMGSALSSAIANFYIKVLKNISFTMEEEKNGKLPFLDVLFSKKPDGTLQHSVYRKPTHMDLNLNTCSFHHSAQK